jgi:hypothetical protein
LDELSDWPAVHVEIFQYGIAIPADTHSDKCIAVGPDAPISLFAKVGSS